jgi:acetate kinase
MRRYPDHLYARFDPPWTPWFLRRNEVVVPVAPDLVGLHGAVSSRNQASCVASSSTVEEALAAVVHAFATHGPSLQDAGVAAVGHRVVHGGSRFADPALVDDALIREVTDLVPLAPLHNPANLEGLLVARRLFPDVPHVAVFDTAFHQTMPPAAYTYAVPRAWREEHRIRRYGFHGTSHSFVSRESARLLEKPVDETNLIVLHLGNGASAAAIRGGQSIDTSMGFTPLEGLVMGTRSGDLDPAVHAYLHRQLGWSIDDAPGGSR